MKLKTASCEHCEKITHFNKKNRTPYKWYRITDIHILFRKLSTGFIINKNIIHFKSGIFGEHNDMDFCSKKCLLNWLSKELSHIRK